jgi:glucoamylase
MIAFGAPGIPPTFAAGDKDLVATALGSSRVWLTIGGGVLNEVFWPNTGRPQLRDLGFLVTGTGFWSEVKRVADYTIATPRPDVPLPTIIHRHERYQLTLRVVCDPLRDAVVIAYDLEDRTPGGDPALAVHVLAAPHLGGSGHDNDAWVTNGVLHASKGAESLAVVAEPQFTGSSAGYVGASDGWQDVDAHGRPQWRFDEARRGNVALTGTCAAPAGTIALAFATSSDGAHSLAVAALAEGFAALADAFQAGWVRWGDALPFGEVDDALAHLARTSAMVIHVHEDAKFPGAIVASLATPWGMAHDDPGGYHLVWPRDCAQAGLGLAAIGQHRDAAHVVHFLSATQSPDGHWPQNFTPDGTAYWTGLQLDETALPVLLAVRLHELGHIDATEPIVRSMVQRACAYLAANGPYSDEDRWEETGGANPFTLAVTIAALAGAASHGLLTPKDSEYALSLADFWNDRVENMVFVRATELDREHGTAGHYARVVPAGQEPGRASIVLANRGGEQIDSATLVGLEFLALVRHGLRSPMDAHIVDTVKIVDAVLRQDLVVDGAAIGPLYHRYQDDGYGEHDDGSPFDGTGLGRLWPLLAGERGLYELDAGGDAQPYLHAMLACASGGGLLPEQVWDAAPIPERRLFLGRPSGSAMPLVWAHAEFLKLYLAATTGLRIDRSTAVAARYATPPLVHRCHLRTEVDVTTDAAEVSIESTQPFRLRFGVDGWQATIERDSAPIALGLHAVVLRRAEFGNANTVQWTRFDLASQVWEGRDHFIRLSARI